MNPYRHLGSGRQTILARNKNKGLLLHINKSIVRSIVVSFIGFLLLLVFHYLLFTPNSILNGLRGENDRIPEIFNRFFYNHDNFQSSIRRWRDNNQQNHHVLVLIQQPISPSFPRDTIIGMIREALSSKNAQVLAYLTNYDSGFVSRTLATFSEFVETDRLIILLSEKSSLDIRNVTISNLSDGLTFAYMLDLASQSTAQFTLVLKVGWKLNMLGIQEDYAEKAVDHYNHIESSRKEANDLNRTCWLDLSDSGTRDATNVIFFNTSEHASRMSIVLRSSLPYYQRNASDILIRFCKLLLWETTVVTGPPLFTLSTENSGASVPLTKHIPSSFFEEHDFEVPSWIDTSVMLGPRKNKMKPPYWMSFGVTAMNRPIVNTTYLEICIDSLLTILEEDFKAEIGFSAVIVVLIGGNSEMEIYSLHSFMENKYSNAMALDMIMLVDSPIESYEDSFRNMRVTYSVDSSERRYWRLKQNLDIATLIRAASGLSDYLMLIEDDTGFHKFFGAELKSTLRDDINVSHPVAIPWTRANFGFGYSGVLFHAFDLPVYAQLHFTFFDELPCDVLAISDFIRDGSFIYGRSQSYLKYTGNLFLRHLGIHSSLEGKTQEVW